jgi:hypothetical protein
LPSQLLVQKTVIYHLFTDDDASSYSSCLKSFMQAVHVMIFKNLIPTNPFNAPYRRPPFCVKIVGRNTPCRRVLFVSVGTGGTCKFWAGGGFCRVVRYCVAQFHVTVRLIADVSGQRTALETPRTHYPTTWRYIPEERIPQVCCICSLVTDNLCVSTWTGTEEYCRAEAMGVILGVVDSTIFETKIKNLLFPRNTDRSSRTNV